MFNSFGNLSIDPSAALLFVDFRRGTILQLSGNATVGWDVPAVGGDDTHTGRRVEFAPQQVIATMTPMLSETHHTPLSAGHLNTRRLTRGPVLYSAASAKCAGRGLIPNCNARHRPD
jgi:hypothetical protein